MKVICDRAALLAAVNNVAAVAPQRTPSPALSCLKLVATKAGGVGELRLSGTDAETSLELSLAQVDVVQPGSAAIPADKLRQIVQALETEPTLTLETDGDTCTIKAGTSRFKIFTYPIDQFPQILDFATVTAAGGGAKATFAHPAGSLLALINRTVFATAKETSRYAINGVLLKRDGKKLEMVATDGRRLALCRSTLKGGDAGTGAAISCIIPTRALNLVSRLAHGPDDLVRLAITDNRIFFAFEDATAEGGKGKDAPKAPAAPRAVLSSALVEGAFPPYEDVIPKDQDKKVTVDRDLLSAGVREAKILTNEESRGVRLAFSAKKKQVKITSRAPEMGESEIDVDLSAYDGEDVEISFNPEFIADMLKTVDDPQVVIELKAPNRPGVIKSGADFLYVVMPVNLPAN